MRKIEQQMVDALKAGKNFAKGNISIQNQNGVSHVTYHDSPIAEYNHETQTLVILDSGYRTASTKSHQNALLSGLDMPFQIHQMDGVWFLFGRDQKPAPFHKRNAFRGLARVS